MSTSPLMPPTKLELRDTHTPQRRRHTIFLTLSLGQTSIQAAPPPSPLPPGCRREDPPPPLMSAAPARTAPSLASPRRPPFPCLSADRGGGAYFVCTRSSAAAIMRALEGSVALTSSSHETRGKIRASAGEDAPLQRIGCVCVSRARLTVCPTTACSGLDGRRPSPPRRDRYFVPHLL
jgi:hypothetical protein